MSLLPSEVRRRVVQALSRAAGRMFASEELVESVLVREGCYQGRAFRLDGWLAIWQIDIPAVRILTPEGQPLAPLLLPSTAPGQRRAA